MARATRQKHLPDRTPRVKPVQRVELSEKHLPLRFLLFGFAVLVAVVSFTYGVSELLSPDAGWQEIAVSQSQPSAAADFTLYYNLGASGRNAYLERRQLNDVYTKACREAYLLFHATQASESEDNLAQINAHPNENVTVHPALYHALEQLAQYESRALYYAPIYAENRSVCYSQDDYEASLADPLLDADARAYHEAVLTYVADPAHVSLELLDDNQVCLHVSEVYHSFAQENGMDAYLDFYWMENAFVADYLADTLRENGLQHAVLSSFDGFVRCLDSQVDGFALTLNGREGKRVIPLSQVDCTSEMSMASLRDYPMTAQDEGLYYLYADGTLRNPYIDPTDGYGKAALPALIAASHSLSCAEVMLRVSPLYIADALDEGALLAAANGDALAFVYSADGTQVTQTPNNLFHCVLAQ